LSYFHSVTLDREKCKGCTNCIKRCPTEAIRVRDGKAHILEERCIDCGECIRICPNQAKVAVTDRLDQRAGFPRNVALVAPSFLGQFGRDVDPERILHGLLCLGFDGVEEVARGADHVAAAIRRHCRQVPGPRPLLSSACPAVVRLTQVRFPSLVDHIIPLHTPMDAAATLARKAARDEMRLSNDQVGVWFITPCPAKMTAIRQPVGLVRSEVTGALSMTEVYGAILSVLSRSGGDRRRSKGSAAGIGWGRAGGENESIGEGALLAVDGIHNVIAVLEEVVRDRLRDVDYLELQACVGGCVGGPLAPENPFLARRNLHALTERLARSTPEPAVDLIGSSALEGRLTMREAIEPRPILQLDEDPAIAIAKAERLEQVVGQLPGLDCGSCGSPHCRSLAEDIVRDVAFETDCVFKLREQVHSLAKEMLELAQKLPPSMGHGQAGKGEGATC